MNLSFYRGGILLLATLLVAFLPEAAQASTATAPKPISSPTSPRDFIPNLGPWAARPMTTPSATSEGMIARNGARTSQPPPSPADPFHVDGLVGSSAASGQKNWTATVSVTMQTMSVNRTILVIPSAQATASEG